MFTLSPKELDFMEILWDADEPLSRQEILDRAAQRTVAWKPNSIHVICNSLMEKGAAGVAGFYLNARKLGRTYQARVTRRQYAMMQVEIAVKNAWELAGMDRQEVRRQLARKKEEGTRP